MQIKNCVASELTCNITWQDDSQIRIPWIWLRDIDPIGFHPQTQERLFDLTSVDIAIQPVKFEHTENEVLLQWEGEEQTSSFQAEWLYQNRFDQPQADAALVPYATWQEGFEPPRFAEQDCQGGEGLSDMLKALKRYGIVIITDLAENELSGELFGDRIGFKRETNFGVMFEVVNKPDPNNLAYTSVALPLHTDLSNQELPPGYQFLHCVANDAEGGESTLADGYAVSEDMRVEAPEHFELLTTVSMPFQFKDREYDIRRRQLIINLDEEGRLQEFVFNAHLAMTPDFPLEQSIAFYTAYQDLMRRIRLPKYRIELKLQAGEMMIFDNRRVMHGRNEFDPSSGYRHLRGYYIDRGEVDSRIRKLDN